VRIHSRGEEGLVPGASHRATVADEASAWNFVRNKFRGVRVRELAHHLCSIGRPARS
jgi:hypothetical protein